MIEFLESAGQWTITRETTLNDQRENRHHIKIIRDTALLAEIKRKPSTSGAGQFNRSNQLSCLLYTDIHNILAWSAFLTLLQN